MDNMERYSTIDLYSSQPLIVLNDPRYLKDLRYA